jgi:hypothetical protein
MTTKEKIEAMVAETRKEVAYMYVLLVKTNAILDDVTKMANETDDPRALEFVYRSLKPQLDLLIDNGRKARGENK